jgi:Tol biopolymer transport system component
MRIARYLAIVGSLLMLISSSAIIDASDEDTLAFSLKRWEGEYETDDPLSKITPSTESIYSIRADGSDLKELVSIKGMSCAAPTYNLDGQWIYYQSYPTGDSSACQVYRCKADGSDREQLTSPARPGLPPCNRVYGVHVAPTGQVLCSVISGIGAEPCVGVLSPDGSQLKLVAPHLGYLYHSAMSPRGDAVVVSGPASDYRLWLLKLPEAYRDSKTRLTKPTVELAPNQPVACGQQFTPDGRTIVFLSGDFVRDEADVYRVESDGTGRRRLTEGDAIMRFRLSPNDAHGSTDAPHVSPDGRHIAYIALRGGTPNVCVMNIDGSEKRQLTFRQSSCGRVRWSPDGEQLSFVSFEGKFAQLFAVPARGGQPRKLTDLDGAIYWAGWKPHLTATGRKEVPRN